MDRQRTFWPRAFFGLLFPGMLLLGTHPAYARSAYITDQFSIDLYAQQSLSGPIETQVVSGSRVTVLEEKDKAFKIKTEGGQQGWILADFIVTESPAQIRLDELKSSLKEKEQEIASLQADTEKLTKKAKDVDWLKAELRKTRKKANDLQNKLNRLSSNQKEEGQQFETIKAAFTEAQNELNTLKVAHEDLQKRFFATIVIQEQEEKRQAQFDPPFFNWEQGIPLPWFLGVVVLFMILGVLAGVALMERKLRKRFGGVRVY